ncbi:MAG: ferredoxin family protein [Candidatus Omnitrophica bacterium]|nr:ferredoxin family protein [Candidatus Omnitrophota bacterium]
MAKIKIDREKCKGCLLCVSVCPKGLITQAEKLNKKGVKPAQFSRRAISSEGGTPLKAGKKGGACLGCSLCAVICPDCCIEVWK